MIPAARPQIGQDEIDAVVRVMESGMLAMGPEVAAFESEFSQVVDGLECVALNSGTSALHIALLSLGIGPGDEVIVPSFSFAATANVVGLVGATPVFVDIDLDSFTLDVAAVEAAITPRTRAIMPVHLYGLPADLPALISITERAGIHLVEDAAQAHLASVDGRPVGSWGAASAFSFYPTKNMMSGEGGMITTGSADVARLSRLYRNQGMEKRYANEVIGFNLRMTDLHAAIGRVQLQKVAGWTAERQKNAAFFDAHLHGVVVPPVAAGRTHVYHQYTIRVVDHDRDRFAEELAARGVGSGVYYPTPIHRLPSFGLELDLPVTERAASEVLSLPVYPSLTEDELGTIVEAVNAVAGAGA
ncbi:MAG: DegT/DnrJ/EryC1/StrS family aminotransferase [Pseudolysinimonas sp.]